MNTITFGGVTSSTYDIYISGEGVWSAPERDAEVITIPGRNGAFVQDNGRFQNITVTYPAFIVKDNNTNFKTKIDGFRNAMASKVGYQRLVDTYHTDEYRMAAFIGGLEVEPILYNDHAATFNLVFECKPQRFLTSGETAVSVANNGTITNPTLFNSNPLLEVKGYGDISIANQLIELNNVTLGDIPLEAPDDNVISINFDSSLVNNSDRIYITNVSSDVTEHMSGIVVGGSYTSASITKTNSDCYSYDVTPTINGSAYFTMRYRATTVSFTVGTSGTCSISKGASLNFFGGGTVSRTYTYVISYDGSSTLTFKCQYNGNTYDSSSDAEQLRAVSSVSALGNPNYIDCDIGEAWKVVNSVNVSINNAVVFGAKLPVLNPGSNTITYDNTITSFKIVPRWWQV